MAQPLTCCHIINIMSCNHVDRSKQELPVAGTNLKDLLSLMSSHFQQDDHPRVCLLLQCSPQYVQMLLQSRNRTRRLCNTAGSWRKLRAVRSFSPSRMSGFPSGGRSEGDPTGYWTSCKWRRKLGVLVVEIGIVPYNEDYLLVPPFHQ